MRTIFNFLGPLTNPAGASRQLLGVSDRHYQETIAEALVGLGSERALVVAAEDGVDELSISAPDAGDRGRRRRAPRSGSSSPASSGSRRAELEDVAGGTPEENAAASRAVLAGEPGPRARPRPAQRRRRDLRRRRRRRPRRGRREGRRGDRLRRGSESCSSGLIAATGRRRPSRLLSVKWE